MATNTLNAPASLSHAVFTTNETSIISMALNLLEEKKLRKGPVLRDMQEFARYLVLRFAGLSNEQGHVLYLNINHELLSADTEFLGNQSSVQWDMRRVVLRAITLGAEHVVFAHNHPGGNQEPSADDIRHLDFSERVLSPLGINLLDSFTVTSSAITSIKGARKANREAELEKDRREIIRRSDERRAKRAATKAAKQADLGARGAV